MSLPKEQDFSIVEKQHGISFLVDGNAQRRSNLYLSLELFTRLKGKKLLLGIPITDRSSLEKDIGETQLRRLIWCPNTTNDYAREIPIDVYNPFVDATGMLVHSYDGFKQWVNPVYGTVTDPAQELWRRGKQIFGRIGEEVFQTRFRKPVRQISEIGLVGTGPVVDIMAYRNAID